MSDPEKPMQRSAKTRAWWPYLDLSRGLAALVVALHHLRSFVFVDFHIADHPGTAWSIFYFITGFGHEAVMIFFVLSGFLVGGAIVRSVENGQWSWNEYAITRMTRLWVVLIPALLLTAFWDHLGMAVTNSSFYNGAMVATYHSGPAPDPSRYNLASFFGNLAFLQTIVVPTFGSNGPLWSLANEFWYYLLFPLLFCSIATKARLGVRLSGITVALIICYALPTELLTSGLSWLCGVVAFVVHKRLPFTLSARNIFLAISGMFLAATLTLSRINPSSEFLFFAISLAFAAMLLPLGHMRQSNSIVAKVSRLGAEFSYTLYLAHFPIAAFLACYVLDNGRLMPSLSSASIFVAFLAIIILYSFGVYLLFERNTRAVRQAILKRVMTKPHSSERQKIQ